MDFIEKLQQRPLSFFLTLGASGLVFGGIVSFAGKKNQLIGVSTATIASALIQNYAFTELTPIVKEEEETIDTLR